MTISAKCSAKRLVKRAYQSHGLEYANASEVHVDRAHGSQLTARSYTHTTGITKPIKLYGFM